MVILDRKACTDLLNGDVVEPLMLPNPESSEDSDEDSIEDAVYDEDYRGDDNLGKQNTLNVVSLFVRCNKNTLRLNTFYGLSHIKNIFFIFKEKNEIVNKD